MIRMGFAVLFRALEVYLNITFFFDRIFYISLQDGGSHPQSCSMRIFLSTRSTGASHAHESYRSNAPGDWCGPHRQQPSPVLLPPPALLCVKLPSPATPGPCFSLLCSHGTSLLRNRRNSECAVLKNILPKRRQWKKSDIPSYDPHHLSYLSCGTRFPNVLLCGRYCL